MDEALGTSSTSNSKVRNFLLVCKGHSTMISPDQRKPGEKISRSAFQPEDPVTMVRFYPSAVSLEAEGNQHMDNIFCNRDYVVLDNCFYILVYAMYFFPVLLPFSLVFRKYLLL